MAHGFRSPGRDRGRGQALVLFVLFLLVLLGCAALAIDYANWLLTDRKLQNVADHAALAGASVFDTRQTQASCAVNPGATQCANAREQAWASISQELGLGLDAGTITCLGAGDTPLAGWTNASQAGCTSVAFGHHVWVATPPPNNASYTSRGGRYALNFGVVFARIDEPTRSYLAGVFGIGVNDRVGWATAGALPTDFALEVFCRNHSTLTANCVNSAGLTIDGQGGIRLVRGDIGSNESLTVTANTGSGVIVENGNVFLVNRTCQSSTWNCPRVPATTGGIADSDPNATPNVANNKNAFYMAPLPVPHFASPLDGNTAMAYDCSDASATDLCVPVKDLADATPSAPGDWSCVAVADGVHPVCGQATGSSGSLVCVGQNGGNPNLDYYPIDVSSGANSLAGTPTQNPKRNYYKNIDDAVGGGADATTPPPASPSDWTWIAMANQNGTQTQTFIVNIGPAGNRVFGSSTVTYVAFKTSNSSGAVDNTGNAETVSVSLLPATGTIPIGGIVDTHTLSGTPTEYSFSIPAGIITDYNALRLQFSFAETGVKNDGKFRGGGVSWATVHHPDPQPPIPPMIPPGYYRSITIPNGDATHHYCAILDPTAEVAPSSSGLPGDQSKLQPFQMPGIYRFGGSGSPNSRKIDIGTYDYLIGDGVTMVFDSDWPDSGSSQGVAIGANGALVLNTMRVPGTPPCTPTEAEAATVNQSDPLGLLQYSGVCAAWSVDPSNTVGVHAGSNSWPSCNPANVDQAHCAISHETDYNPTSGYRGITFYFTPSAWPPSSISSRFEMQGSGGGDPGLAFRGVLYAPYDDVKITGGNGFNTVGQVLSWTAKFNGGSAYIDLDYPYEFTPSAPYLLEPTIAH